MHNAYVSLDQNYYFNHLDRDYNNYVAYVYCKVLQIQSNIIHSH